jgi:hypothetical protein
MKKIKTENGLKLRLDLKQDKKSLISGRNKLQVSLNGTAVIDVVPTRQIEENEIIILENITDSKKYKLSKEGLELLLVGSAEKIDDFGICYDTETNEIKFYGEGEMVYYTLPLPAEWVIRFKTKTSWMSNRIWLNPVFV